MFANRALHWVTAKFSPGSSYIILGFDLGLKRFIEIPSPVAHNGNAPILVPVVFSRNGKDELLVVNSSKLVWYDSERNVAKNVRIHGHPSKFGVE
ncbi:hypothetical protein AgCh_032815 [Apium graveolens]